MRDIQQAGKPSFAQLLAEYRSLGVHFLKLVTDKQEYLFIMDDSYYMTYWEDTEDIVYSLTLQPKTGSGAAPLEFYEMNHRNLQEWYQDAKKSFAARADKDLYEEPHRSNIRISYLNDETKVPLKDFLDIIPRTEYRVCGSYILFLEMGTSLKKIEKVYHEGEEKWPAFLNLCMHRKEIRRFTYEQVHTEHMLSLHESAIKSVLPADYGSRFVFDDGDIRVFRHIY